MRDRDDTLRFLFLHGVIQEEIDQDSIHMRLRMMTNNLTPDKFHAPDTATAQLDFPGVTATNRLETSDMMLQWWAILQAAQRVEHLWYPIVSEHRNFVDVVEFAIASAFKACP